MNKKQAIARFNSNWWEGKTAKEIVGFQLYEKRLCMPFGLFHKAMEEVLDRPVFTHEFADYNALQGEYEGKREYDGLDASIKRVIPKDTPVIKVIVD